MSLEEKRNEIAAEILQLYQRIDELNQQLWDVEEEISLDQLADQNREYERSV